MSFPVNRIGYIGLGNAGYPIASHLARSGYALAVEDADPKRAERFAREHDHATASSDFSGVDMLITMLPNGEIVRDVVLDLAKTLKSGCVIIDTSSSSPFHTRETSKMLKDVNGSLVLVDSPITQEYAFALAKGEATLMVGCDDEKVLGRIMPVLKCMGKYVFHMGGLGAGHAMKTLNNYTSAASILGLCDALIAGQKFGLRPEKMIDVMNVGTGINFSTKESFKSDGLTRKFQSGYQLALLVKDMRIARNVIEKMGIQSPLAALMVAQLEAALTTAGEGSDHTEVIKDWEKRAGIELIQSKL